MGWRATGDVAEFVAVAGDFLRTERARNTVLLTVSESLRAHPARSSGTADSDRGTAPLFGWWTGRPHRAGTGGIAGAFLHTPPFPVLLTRVSVTAAAALATTLAGRQLAGVNAHPVTAAVFADAWRDRTGCRVDVHRRFRLYRLAELSWPDPAPDGASRVAGEPDAPLLTGWFAAFAREVNELDGDSPAAGVRNKLGYGGITVWEAGGSPVSVAGVTGQVAGVVRVGLVYTPPALRGRGYASAVTAAASQRALSAGAEEVVLYTDLANPVSNSIYQRIGYQPVEDRVVLAFSRQ